MSRSRREMREPFKDLANAVIVQAAEDWREAVRVLNEWPGDIDARRMKDECEAVRVLNEWPGDIDARRMKDECEAFLLSDRYEQLTKMDGARLLRMLRKEAGFR